VVDAQKKREMPREMPESSLGTRSTRRFECDLRLLRRELALTEAQLTSALSSAAAEERRRAAEGAETAALGEQLRRRERQLLEERERSLHLQRHEETALRYEGMLKSLYAQVGHLGAERGQLSAKLNNTLRALREKEDVLLRISTRGRGSRQEEERRGEPNTSPDTFRSMTSPSMKGLANELRSFHSKMYHESVPPPLPTGALAIPP
tara:strand:+ start:284 stop:904 length:621 start_codon:yes stop_codon:yes gene_type:complete